MTLDVDDAANVIAGAVSSAFTNIQLPKLEVETTGVSVPLEVPAAGIPIDTSALATLNLGNSVGADIRNRVDALEGRTVSLREEIFTVSTSLEGVDLTTLGGLSAKLTVLETNATTAEGNLASLRLKVDTQETAITQAVDFKINERFNEGNLENDVQARLDRAITRIEADVLRVESLVTKAMSQAGKAMSLAMARR